MDAWIGVVGAAVGAAIGALALLASQLINGQATEGVAYRARRNAVLDDVSRQVASVRERGVTFAFNSDLGSEEFGAAILALDALTPRIYDRELRQLVDAFVLKALEFRGNPEDWTSVYKPFESVRQRLTKVFEELG